MWIRRIVIAGMLLELGALQEAGHFVVVLCLGSSFGSFTEFNLDVWVGAILEQ